MENKKKLDFIYEYFFQRNKSTYFEKNYFHLFSPPEYYRVSIIFSNETISSSIILL